MSELSLPDKIATATQSISAPKDISDFLDKVKYILIDLQTKVSDPSIDENVKRKISPTAQKFVETIRRDLETFLRTPYDSIHLLEESFIQSDFLKLKRTIHEIRSHENKETKSSLVTDWHVFTAFKRESNKYVLCLHRSSDPCNADLDQAENLYETLGSDKTVLRRLSEGNKGYAVRPSLFTLNWESEEKNHTLDFHVVGLNRQDTNLIVTSGSKDGVFMPRRLFDFLRNANMDKSILSDVGFGDFARKGRSFDNNGKIKWLKRYTLRVKRKEMVLRWNKMTIYSERIHTVPP